MPPWPRNSLGVGFTGLDAKWCQERLPPLPGARILGTRLAISRQSFDAWCHAPGGQGYERKNPGRGEGAGALVRSCVVGGAGVQPTQFKRENGSVVPRPKGKAR
jgi:hypothetical protein